MASALNKILSELHFKIPSAILNLAFLQNNGYRNIVTSVDENIITKVIRGRLLPDIDLASQEALVIPLGKCNCLFADETKSAYFIPKELTEGRSIISVLGMLSGYSTYSDTVNTDAATFGSSLLNNGNKLLNSLDDVNIRQTARIDLVGENTILINEGYIQDLGVNVKVVVENDANLNNINPKAYLKLSHLATLCVKAYIYNDLVININKGMLYSGHELNIIKDIVDEYKEAELEYQEYYNTVWKKVAFMQNSENMDNFVSGMFGAVI